MRRADLPEENSQAIYDRMKSERQREAAQYRAEGAEQAQEIRANADRQRIEILAEAQKQSQILRGEGDADSIQHLRRRLRQGQGVLRLLPLAAGLSQRPVRPGHDASCCRPTAISSGSSTGGPPRRRASPARSADA